VTGLTHDSISFRGAGVVAVTQQKKGARFTMDSLLLADFCRVNSRDRILEPGAGTGIISLLLAKRYPHTQIIAVEMHHATAELCRVNIAQNGLERRITLIVDDITHVKSALKPSSFDVIIANPPYSSWNAGRKSPSFERQTARHDKSAPLAAWLDLHTQLKNKGRYCLVFSAGRAAELLSLLRENKLEPKRLRFVHPADGKPAYLVLIEAVKSAGIGLEVMPPLIICDTAGSYTREIREIYHLP
jgi:tRNA1Val (adenine37-N6)-methyltransferase